MRTLAPLLLLLLAPSLAFAQAHHYTHVSGPSLTQSPPAEGAMVQLVDATAPHADTLNVWVQDAGPDKKPSYGRAADADAVVWCYPDLYAHSNHLLPDAEGEIVSLTGGDSVVFTERGSQTHTVYSSRMQ